MALRCTAALGCYVLGVGVHSRPHPSSSPEPALPHRHLQQSTRVRTDILQGALRNNCWKSNRCPVLFNSLLTRKTGGLEQPQRRLPVRLREPLPHIYLGHGRAASTHGITAPFARRRCAENGTKRGGKEGVLQPLSLTLPPAAQPRRAARQPQPDLRSPQRAEALGAGCAPTSCSQAGSGKREARGASHGPTSPRRREGCGQHRAYCACALRAAQPTETSRRVPSPPGLSDHRRALPAPFLPPPSSWRRARAVRSCLPRRRSTAHARCRAGRRRHPRRDGARARAAPEGETRGGGGGDGCGEGGGKVAVRAGPRLESPPGGGERGAASGRRRRREVRWGVPADPS